jgi:DNA-binding CsgD family transcriptional regulator
MLDDEIQSLQIVLGNFSDRLRQIATRLPCRPSSNGCLTTSERGIFDIPGLDPLYPGLRNDLITGVQRLDAKEVPDVFLFKHLSAWFRVHTGMVDEGARSFIVERCVIPFDLTERELQIIELLISGDTNHEIAAKIFLARATVAKHLENIFQKLGCNSRTSVVSTALATNLRLLGCADTNPGRRPSKSAPTLVVNP